MEKQAKRRRKAINKGERCTLNTSITLELRRSIRLIASMEGKTMEQIVNKLLSNAPEVMAMQQLMAQARAPVEASKCA